MSIFAPEPTDRFNSKIGYRPPTGFSENYNSAYETYNFVDGPASFLEHLKLDLQPHIDAYEKRTGKSVPYIRPAEPGFERRSDGVYHIKEEHAEYVGLKARLDYLREFDDSVETFEELEQKVMQRMPYIQQRHFHTARNQTFLGAVGEFLGETKAVFEQGMVYPQAIGFAVIGKRANRGVFALMKAAGVDAIAAAAAVGSTQPFVQYFKEKYGLRHTTQDMINNTGMAGLAAFGLRFGLQGTGRLAKVSGKAAFRKIAPGAAFGRELNNALKSADPAQIDQVINRMSIRQQIDLLKDAEDIGLKMPPEVHGAMQIAEREATILADNPYQNKNSYEAGEEHNKHFNAAYNALLNDTAQVDLPPSSLPVKQTGVHHFDELNGTLERLDIDNIEVDAKLFQFKSGSDAQGVTERLAGEKKWNQVNSNVALTYEYADGRRFIADGHQRLALAKRIKAEDPSQDVQLYSYVLRETDGVTVEQARVIAAMKNISEITDNKSAQYIDAAKVLRVDPARIEDIPQSSNFVSVTRGLTSLDDEAFGLVVNEIVPPNYAALVGRLEKDAAKQMAIMRLLAKTEPANITQAEAIVRQARDMDFTKTTQDSLFGEEVMLESLFAERAKVLDEALKILQRDQNTFANLVRNEKTIAEGGNKLETESNRKRAEINGQAKQTITTLASRTGDISTALSNAAKRFKETGKAAPAARDFAEFVRGGIERGDFARVSVSPPIRTFEPAAKNDRLAASAAAEQIDAFATPTGPKADAALDRLENEFVESITAQPTDADLISRGEIAPDYRYYLEPTSDSIDISIQNIVPIRRRPDGVANAKMFMAEAALGDKAKRGPLSVKDNGDGTYELLDGNSTYAIAAEAGMPKLPARVLTDQEFATEVAQKNAKKMLEMGPGAKKKRLVLAQDLSRAELRDLADTLKSRQAYASIDDIMARNEAFNVELNAAVQKAAGEHKVDYFAGPLKARDRVEAKINDKYVGELNRISDASRATIAVSTPREADAFIKSLAKKYHVVDEGYQATGETSYFDKKLMVIDKDGTIGEVKIIERNLYDASKMQGGHGLYQIERGDLDTAAIIAELPDPEMRARLERLSGDELIEAAKREQVQLYTAARAQMGSEFSEIADNVLGSMPATTRSVSNSDAVSSGVRVSAKSSRADISPQDSRVFDQENALPSLRSTAGKLPSSEKNLIDETSTTNEKIASEITDAGAQADLLDSLVPTGRVVDGEVERVSARSLFEEIESDKSMLDRLKDCV